MGWKRDERKEIKEKEREEGIEIRMEGGEDNEEEVKKKRGKQQQRKETVG